MPQPTTDEGQNQNDQQDGKNGVAPLSGAAAPRHAAGAGVRGERAEAWGLPLHRVGIPPPSANGQCRAARIAAIARATAAGITAMAFGDLFLGDIRRYRVEQLAGTGIEAIF